MPKKGSRDAKNDTRNSKELIYGTRATRENTSVSYSCKGTLSWKLGKLITMFVPHITKDLYKRLYKAFVSIHIEPRAIYVCDLVYFASPTSY